MKKVFSKIAKIGLRVIGIFFLLTLISAVLISVPAIQTRVVHKLTKSVSESIGTEVTIGSVRLGWTGTVELTDVLVLDKQQDSMFFIEEIETHLIQLNRTTQEVTLGKLVLQQPLVNFKQGVDATEMNYQFLVDLSRQQSGGGGIWNILFKNVEIIDGSFRFLREGYDAPTDREFDENDFAFNHIQGSFKDFYLVGDSLNFKVKNLSTVEKNGLKLERLVCKANVHNAGMEFSDMLFVTERSEIQDYLAFDYNSYRDFVDFLDIVTVRTNLDKATVNVKDLEYFSTNLTPYKHNIITVSGEAHGVVSNFKVNDFAIQIGENTRLQGDVDLKGLPEWRNTFIKLKLQDFSSSAGDVTYITTLDLPDKLKRFRQFDFAGHLTGFYSDFAADGVLTSEIGQLESRINFKLLEDENARYTGNLSATNFELGTFLGNKELGMTDFTFEVKEGNGLTFENLNAQFVGGVKYVDYQGVRLTGIEANGHYTNQKFDGKAWMSDPNLDFVFNGKIDFSKTLPQYDFNATVNNINLSELKIDVNATKLSGNIDIEMVGDDRDNLQGYARLANVSVTRKDKVFEMDTMYFKSSFTDTSRRVEVVSDVVDGYVEGNFSLHQLDLAYKDFLNTLFPEFYEAVEIDQEIVANGEFIIRENDLIDYWSPLPLALGNGSFRFKYDMPQESIEAWSDFDKVVYDGYTLEVPDLVIRKRPHQLLNMSLEVDKLINEEVDTLTSEIVLDMSILPNYLEFMLDFADTNTNVLALRSYGNLEFLDDTILVALEESSLYLDHKPWVIDNGNSAIYTRNQLTINNLNLHNGKQRLQVNGIIDDDKNHFVKINTNELDLRNFNPFLASQDIEIGGVSNDSIRIYQVLNRPAIQGNLGITNLSFQGDTLGDFEIVTTTDNNPLIMDVKAKVTNGLFKNVVAEGMIDLSRSDGEIDMVLRAQDAAIKPLETFFEGIASSFSGKVDSDIHVYGKIDNPKFEGYVQAKRVHFLVDYLNTEYFVDDKVRLSDTKIGFPSVQVKDKYGQTAVVTGSIKHDYFSDMVFDVYIDKADKIMVLNTTKENNDVFYGTGFGSGKASFTGPVDDLLINISAKSNKGTLLTIPIYDDSDNTFEDYITFKQPAADTTEQEVVSVEESKIKMHFEIEITEDANFVLLFDEVLDDKISGNGTGNIKMDYATGEDFFMYGVFEISNGIYPFSSPTLVSEKFDLRRGGQIVWNGDPYNAQIDLQAAVARNRANPLDLMIGMVEGKEELYNKQIKMNVLLNLQGELFNPNISFGWEFPDITSSTLTEFNSMIKKIEADNDEMNRQVFSLMTFGSFTPASDFGQNLGTGNNDYRDIVSSSIGTFLSNQVNNWISEYDKDLELGVDYKTRSGITDQERAEIILSARRKIMNERIELALEYNANSSASKDPYNVGLVYKVKKDGSLKLKAYHKRASDPTLGDVSNVNTTGVGFYFRKQFNRIRLRKNKVKPE